MAHSRGGSCLWALSTAGVGETTGESEKEDEARGLGRRSTCRGRSGQAAGTRRTDWDGERAKGERQAPLRRPTTRRTSDGSLWLRRVCGAKSRGSWRSLAGMTALPGVCVGSDDIVALPGADFPLGRGPGLRSGRLRLCLATGASPTVVDCVESPGMTGSPTIIMPLDRPRDRQTERERERDP